MKAVIMAGGMGTRLASVLTDIPKPMVRVRGRPLLEYQIEALRAVDIRDITIVIGHLGDRIKEHFGNGDGWGVRISYFEETEPLGTAGSFFFIKDAIDDDFLLLFGDVFHVVDYRRFMGFHDSVGSEITLFTHPNSHPYDSDIVLTDVDGRVTGWSGKKDERVDDLPNLVNGGIYIISKRALDLFVSGERCDLEKDIIRPNIPLRKIYAYRSTEYMKDIGTPDRLDSLERDLDKDICERRKLSNRQRCVFIDRDGTINRHVGFLKDREDFELEKGVAEALRLLNSSEYLSIVVTNQAVIARGQCTFDDLDGIHNRMHTLLGKEGAYVDDLYFCPHHPDSGFDGEVKELKIECGCRKPNTGMVDLAAKEHNIDIGNSWIVGDTTIDIMTGRNAGLHTALVRTGLKGEDGRFDVSPDRTFDTLLDFVKFLLELP